MEVEEVNDTLEMEMEMREDSNSWSHLAHQQKGGQTLGKLVLR